MTETSIRAEAIIECPCGQKVYPTIAEVKGEGLKSVANEATCSRCQQVWRVEVREGKN